MADRGGQQLGNYQLIGLLGEGSFARVYLGEHRYLGTQAAIKVLYTRLTSQEIEDFRTEARTIANLVHPNIVRVFDFGLEEGTPFLVMDYAPFGTLRQHYGKGATLPLPTTVSYVKQVAAALQYAHDNKLIHRDVKPENMLFGRHKEVLLSDFGIAIVTQSSRYQSAQNIMGTISYMAPEQIQGKPRPASDQYSLGVVVYEWLSGERPFQGSFTEVVAQHMAVPPPPLHEKVPTISPDVEQVVLKALAKDPQQRFPDMHTFAIALEQACGIVAQSSPPLDLPFRSPIEPIPSDQPLLPVHTLPAGSQPLQTDAETILPSFAQTTPSAQSSRSFPVSPVQHAPRAKKTSSIAISVIVLLLLLLGAASGVLISRNTQSSYAISSPHSPSPTTMALAQAQTPTPAATPSPTPTPIPTSTPVPVPTPTFTPIPAQAPLPSPTPSPQSRPPTSMTVSATQGWQTSGVFVNTGDQVSIQYISGLWTSTVGSIAPFDGRGRPDGYTCANFLPASQCAEPVPDAVQGELVGKVGTQLLKIGNDLQFTAIQSGTLYLRMNDGDGGLYDNQGSLTIQIEIS